MLEALPALAEHLSIAAKASSAVWHDTLTCCFDGAPASILLSDRSITSNGETHTRITTGRSSSRWQ